MQLYIKAPFCHATKDYTHVIFGPKLFRVFLHQTENECLTPLPLLNTQKESGCPSNQVSAAAMTSASDENGELSIVFSV